MIEESDAMDALATELLEVHEQSYGTGAARATVLMNDNAIVVFLDGLELPRSEQFLVEAGDGDAVVEMRRRHQRAIEARYRSIVERTTGRRVTSFLSATELAHRYVVEIFRLAPEGGE